MDRIRIGNDHLSVEVAALGAEMQSIATSDGRQWLWRGDPAFWAGRSPILFPMVGKAPNDTVSIDGKPYAMGQHGFARRSTFRLVDSQDDRCTFRLAASDATRAVYPFDFTLDVEHLVDGAAVVVTATVTNTGQRTMPFGLGFHPAFAWPLPGAEGKPHHIVLDNDAEPPRIQLAGGLVDPTLHPSPFTAGALTLDHGLFAADAMIFPEGAGNGLRYGPEAGPSLHFTWRNLPNLALWTKPGAPFICLEPWHGTAAERGGSDDLAKRPYAVHLSPGDRAEFSFRAEIAA